MGYVVMALGGAAIGSFLSVVLDRLGNDGGIIAGRSRCPECRHTLAWYDLVPLISFCLVRGRCRYCRASISWVYPMLEVASAGLALLWYRQYGPQISGQEGLLLLILFGLFALALHDARRFILPDAILAVLALAIVVFAWATHSLGQTLLSAFLASLVFAILYVVSKGRWIGLGDIKLLAVLGATFPYAVTVLVLLAAIWSAALVGFGMMVFGRATFKTPLPFGTFLSAMGMVAILFAHELRFFTGLIPRIF